MKKMNHKNWKLDEDGTQVHSVAAIPIPWLDLALKTWFEIEEHQTWWTEKQQQTFEQFLQLNTPSKQELIQKLNSVYTSELEKGNIETVQFEEVLDAIDWEQSHICVPQLDDSEHQYLLLLPETKWKKTGSDFTLELEILYTNGTIEIVQEMSGLWNRMEWFEKYLKRKTINHKV